MCDTVRTKFKTLRTSGAWYYLLDPIRERLTQSRSLKIPVSVFILSYTHSENFAQLVKDLWPWEQSFIDCAITTSSRVGQGGKVWALEQLCCDSSKVWRADDNSDICDEILRRPQDSPVAIRAAGIIKVPKHWRHQRTVPLYWYNNILEALDNYIEAFKDAFPDP